MSRISRSNDNNFLLFSEHQHTPVSFTSRCIFISCVSLCDWVRGILTRRLCFFRSCKGTLSIPSPELQCIEHHRVNMRYCIDYLIWLINMHCRGLFSAPRFSHGAAAEWTQTSALPQMHTSNVLLSSTAKRTKSVCVHSAYVHAEACVSVIEQLLCLHALPFDSGL